MKKTIIHLIGLIVILTSLCSCSMINNTEISEKYKRIEISSPSMSNELSDLEKTVSFFTKVEFEAKETFSETMPIYKITPRKLSEEEMIEFGEACGVVGEVNKTSPRTYIKTPNEDTVRLTNGNELSYYAGKIERNELTKSDDELIQEAKAIKEKINFLEGEYECLGVTSVVTTENNGEEYVTRKRISFRKILNGSRIIGNEIFDIYFCSGGLYGIELHLFEYEEIGEMELIPLKDAKDKIKKPDAFALTESDGKSELSEKADTLRVERVKLLYVNQYSDGCTIIQPVYNFMGTATVNDESLEFSSRVIAIPEKYTYTEEKSDSEIVPEYAG